MPFGALPKVAEYAFLTIRNHGEEEASLNAYKSGLPREAEAAAKGLVEGASGVIPRIGGRAGREAVHAVVGQSPLFQEPNNHNEFPATSCEL